MSDSFKFRKRNQRSIANLSNLLKALRLTQDDYDAVLALNDEDKYIEKLVPKSDGTNRVVYNPHPSLRKIQRQINRSIFNQESERCGLIVWPHYIYGSIPNSKDQTSGDIFQSKDYISCAKNHCLSKSVMKLDISDFFDNIHRDHVCEIFTKLLKYPEEVSDILTDLCTNKGRVVQGALTSSYIASAILFDVEPELVIRLERKNLRYTRLVDDITISSTRNNYDFSLARELVKQMLYSKDLPINENKTEISYSSTETILVHGLRINFKEPRLPSNEVSKIRASVKNLELLAQDSVYRVSRDYRKSYNRCLGRVNKLKRLGHNQHEKLSNRVQRIQPLPNKNDIKRVGRLVSRLEEIYDENYRSYRYRKIYYRTQYEINILQRSFSNVSASYRDRLRKIKPPKSNWD